jgi:hypothetical protein
MDAVGLRVATKQIRNFSTFLESVMHQVLVLQQGASRLQTTSANLWTSSMNIISRSRIHFPFLNPTELRHYHVTFIILLSSIKY